MRDSEIVLGMGQQGEGVLSQWLEGFVGGAITAKAFAIFDQLDSVLPQEPTLGFQGAFIKAREYLVSHAPDEISEARYLNNLSNDYGAAGRQSGSLKASREAVDLYRWLKAASPARYEPDLARSISVISDRLEEQGQTNAAIAATGEALQLMRPYAEHYPDREHERFYGVMQQDLGRLSSGKEPDTLDDSE